MNITWTVTHMKGVDVGASLGTVVTEVGVKVTAAKDGKASSSDHLVKVCKPKLHSDGVTWYVPTVDPDRFLQYDTVTEQDVIAWVKDTLGYSEVAVIESTLSQQVDRILTAPVIPKPVVLTPPWA